MEFRSKKTLLVLVPLMSACTQIQRIPLPPVTGPLTGANISDTGFVGCDTHGDLSICAAPYAHLVSHRSENLPDSGLVIGMLRNSGAVVDPRYNVPARTTAYIVLYRLSGTPAPTSHTVISRYAIVIGRGSSGTQTVASGDWIVCSGHQRKVHPFAYARFHRCADGEPQPPVMPIQSERLRRGPLVRSFFAPLQIAPAWAGCIDGCCGDGNQT